MVTRTKAHLAPLRAQRKINKMTFSRAWHVHSCARCKARYTDRMKCTEPMVNGLCEDCTGAGRPSWDRDADPIACCMYESEQASRQDRERFELAGSTDWWICRQCQRQSPVHPATLRKGTEQ